MIQTFIDHFYWITLIPLVLKIFGVITWSWPCIITILLVGFIWIAVLDFHGPYF